MSKVCVVTGAGGYISSHIVKLMINKGFEVRGTVRNVTASRSLKLVEAYKHLPGPGKLVLYQADILHQESLTDALFADAEYVFHVASPFQITADDPEAELLRPAREGTSNVLAAAARHKATLRRVVVTSSVCAVKDMTSKQPKAGGGSTYSENDWNGVSTTETEPYFLSKVQGERAAWAASKELGLDVVTILPNFVMGPVINPDVAGSTSVGFFKAFLEAPGDQVPAGSFTICDVRDVAQAHVLAAQTPSASGRYLISSDRSVDAKHITDVLKTAFPRLDIPDGSVTEEVCEIDASRVTRDLGLKYTPSDETLVDMAKSLIDLGISVPRFTAVI